MLRDPLGVAADTGDRRRRRGVHELETDEVETRLVSDYSALVDGLLPVAQNGEVDPREAGPVAGAPDHVGDDEHATVLGDGLSIGHAGDPADALDAGAHEVLRLCADEWCCLGDEASADLSAQRRAHGQDVVAEEADEPDHDVPADVVVDSARDVPGFVTREERRALSHELHRDLGAGVADADDERRAVHELFGTAVVVRVQLPDRGVELGRERRDFGLLEVRHGHDDVVGFEGLVA